MSAVISRLLLAGALAAGAVLVTAPASPADQPTGSWTNPAPQGGGDVPVGYVQSHQPLEGAAEHSGGIASVDFILVEDAPPGDACSAQTGTQPQTVVGGSATHVAWAFEVSFPCNRRYQVRATVRPQSPVGHGTSPELVLNLEVAVAIPASSPDGFAVEVGDDRRISLRWEPPAAPAPDFAGYELRRSVDGREAEPLADLDVSTTSFLDDDVPDDASVYSYELRAMRPGPDGGTTVYSAPATATAEVPPLPPDPEDEDGGDDDGDDDEDGASGGGTSGSGGARPIRRTYTPPRPAPRTPGTVDTGYEQTLPFGDQEVAGPADPELPTGDNAVIAELEGDDDEQRQTMLLVAGGSAAAGWAFLLRTITRRAKLL